MDMSKIVLSFAFAAAACAALPAAEFTFAPNVQPRPVSMTVESNTLVRLDRDMTVSIACKEGGEAAADWAETRFGEWFRLTKTGWLFTSVNAPRVESAAFTGAPVEGGDEAYELEVRTDGV